MRDNRSSLLLLLSLILFLMSFVILCTWGYNTYFKPRGKKKTSVLIKDTAAISNVTRDIANATRDSLQKVYNETINSLGSRIDSSLKLADSLREPFNAKFAEFLQLRNEILSILKEKGNDANLGIARRKITELQQRVNELNGKNVEVELENKKLYELLRQYAQAQQPSNESRPSQQNNEVRPVVLTNIVKPEKTKEAENAFMAYDLRLSAMMVTDNKELETYQAIQTDKFVGSFVVKNNNSLNNIAEMVIVIVRPDGQVLQKSTWESGTFESNEGRKVYSCKMRFDYTKGEPKKLLFSLSSENYIKGNYIMQVYYNGALIGKISKLLS